MGEIFSFGAWVRRRRKALDLTQDALAHRVGCAVSMIRKIEADERRPSRQIATLVAGALEIPAAEREQFLRAARAELTVDKLAAPLLPSAPEPPLVTLPTGTVTFLFTDIAGSTRLWEQHPSAMQLALARHDSILRNAIVAHGGTLVKGTGDGMHAAFARATDAMHAALAAQRALQAEPWHAFVYADSPKSKTQNPKSKIELRVRMALHLGVTDERGGDYFGPAVNRAARLLAVGHGGQILLSHAVGDVVRDHLPPDTALRDLGAHQLKDLSRAEQIWQLTVPDLPADFPPLVSLSKRRHNLPIQLTSFVGREHELAAITRQLDTTHLLTLTGPGGTGKTRLSLQVAAELLATSHEPSAGNGGRFADGVWLVELAALADPALVPQAVATALELREDAGRPLLATLTDFLRGKDLLLLIDNCEHVVDACAQLAETLLRACPQVRILASSREALGIAGEVARRVPPLAVPPAEFKTASHAPDQVAALAQYESIRLFVARAASVLPGFTVTKANAPALAQICARLDGIPLAIELAAARANVLRVEQIAARLDDRFRLLTGGSRTAVPRQQTLRALIDWSYDLLAASEQLLLQRLAVFVAGWTLEAAEAVCAGGSLNQEDVLDVLTQLVNKSLVVAEREQSHETRYRLLETIRQYALERLAASGAADVVRRRHAEHYLALAKQAVPELYGAQQYTWLNRLRQDYDNLRAALGWVMEQDAAELGVRLVDALSNFWFLAGYISEGVRWATALVAQARAAWPVELRAQVLGIAGFMAWQHGNYAAALGSLEESSSIYRHLGDKRSLAGELNRLGRALLFVDDHARARMILEECTALSREIGDLGMLANSLHGRAYVAMDQADYAAARALLEQSLSIYQTLGEPWGIAQTLNHLGDIERCEGDYEQAAAYYQESLALFQAQGIQVEIAAVLHNLGYAVLTSGDQRHARTCFAESLALHRQQGNRPGILESLAGFGALIAEQGQPRLATILFGAIVALRAALSAPMWPAERVEYERHLAATRAQLDEATFAAAWAAGQQLTLEEAVAEALAET